jgi:hypothetical protein
MPQEAPKLARRVYSVQMGGQRHSPKQSTYHHASMMKQRQLQQQHSKRSSFLNPQKTANFVLREQQSLSIVDKMATSKHSNAIPPLFKKQGIVWLVRSGWMLKRGNVRKSWKKRFFKFYSDQDLYYFDKEDNMKEKGLAKLQDARVVKKVGNNSLQVVTPKREWHFVCQNTQERDDWVRIISAICKCPIEESKTE